MDIFSEIHDMVGEMGRDLGVGWSLGALAAWLQGPLAGSWQEQESQVWHFPTPRQGVLVSLLTWHWGRSSAASQRSKKSTSSGSIGLMRAKHFSTRLNRCYEGKCYYTTHNINMLIKIKNTRLLKMNGFLFAFDNSFIFIRWVFSRRIENGHAMTVYRILSVFLVYKASMAAIFEKK